MLLFLLLNIKTKECLLSFYLTAIILSGINNYIIRITRDEVLNKIYGHRIYYIGIRRNWSKDSTLVFIKKVNSRDDAFIGTGVIDETLELDKLDSSEKKICIENNWYKKIIFGKLVRFHPAVLVKDTPIICWIQKGPLLHGHEIRDSDISKIQSLSSVTITS
jgi:hypothetical protein